MTQTTDRRLLRDALEPARSGNLELARGLLADYTHENPGDALGWLWRAGVAQSPELAFVWLRQLLEREPGYEPAVRALRVVRLQAAVAATSTNPDLARHLFLE